MAIKPHILFLPRWYPHLGDPMNGLFVKNQAECLAADYQISILNIITSRSNGQRLTLYEDFLNDVYTITVSINLSAYKLVRPVLLVYYHLIALHIATKRIFSQCGKPQLSHVHVLTRTGLSALWFKWMYGIPFVVSEHWSRYFPENNQYKGVFRKLITQIILKQSSALICVSRILQSAMQRQGVSHPNTYIVPNVVNTEHFQPASFIKKHDGFIFIHISCFEEKSKNIKGLLKAMKILLDGQYHITLHLIGDGADKEMLLQYAREKGLDEDHVIFHSTLLPSEVALHLQQADFLIQTSHYETFGTVVIESFACGVPVVSTPVGIFPELYQPELGVLIPSASENDIAQSMIHAMRLAGIFDRQAMREIAVRQFSNGSVKKQLSSIYLRFLPQHPS